MEAQLLLDAKAELAEGPVWDSVHERLLWVNILQGEVHATTPSGDDSIIWCAESPVGCIAPRADGSWIVAERDRLTAVWDWSRREELVVLPIDDDVRTNDGKLDPLGRMVFGTMQFDGESHRGQLFSWDESGLRVLIEPVTISNGLGWNADCTTMYYIDTRTLEVAAFDYSLADGNIGARHVVTTLDETDGHPDGMCVDSDGSLWVALWGGREVRHFSPDGHHLESVSVDAQNVSCCTFGGGHMYITTARIASPEQPGDGALYRWER